MDLVDDLRRAARTLVRQPGFALLATATLALGIGANAAIFSVVKAVILRPLAYPRPDELVYVSSQFPAMGFDQFWVSPPEFLELQQRSQSFALMGAYTTGQSNVAAADRPMRVASASVSTEVFQVLGVPPRVGRGFEKSETLPGGEPVVVLSDALWRSAFGADAALLGAPIEVSGIRRRVVGIMPPGYDIADEHVQLWLPLVIDPATLPNRRGNHLLYLVGRLRDDTTFARAQAELETLLAAWPTIVAPSSPGGGVHVPNTTTHRLLYDHLQAHIVGSARTAVLVLQGAVVLVLLIACANVANLLLARAESRQKEFAVRAALGAGRVRLVRPFLAEGLLVAGAGAALGVVVGIAGLRALMTAYPDSLPRSADVRLDAGVLIFTIVVAVGSAAVFGLAPLLHLSPKVSAAALKESGQRTTSGKGARRARRSIVATELALAVALVVGAGLLLRTVLNLSRVDAGFRRDQLITFGVSLPPPVYSTPVQIASFYERLLADLRALPGVRSVAAMSGLPPVRPVNANDTDIEGFEPKPGGPFANIDYYQTATAGYVETMGIPVVEGRAFEPSDRTGTAVLVNETMARTFYGSRSAIGRRVRPCCGPTVPWLTIVGVLKDVKQGGVDQKTGTELYFNFEQLPTTLPRTTPVTMNIVLRSAMPLAELSGPIIRSLAALDPALPVVKLRTMDDVFAEATGRPRLLADLLGIFAGLAVLLALVGSYGVLSYMVSERRREIGIRMALGAGRKAVVQMVLGEGMRLTTAGVLFGMAGALVGARVLRSLLFGVTPADPLTLAGVVLLVVGVSLIGCYVPARSATRVDPNVVLRED